MTDFKRSLCVLLAAAALFALLVSCSEVEDLIDGEELLPDLTTDDFRDENGVVRWPAEMLPEGFPVPNYVEVYSVNREHNVVTITVFSEFDNHVNANNWKDKMPHISFSTDLASLGYFHYYLIGNNPDFGGYFYNKANKTRVIIYQSIIGQNYYGEHLAMLMEKSPTGFVMQVIVDKTILQPESLLWDYPSEDTDLGLEAMKFDEWPSEYLSADLPSPVGQGINVKLTMEQKKNGVFITVSGELDETEKFRTLMMRDYATLSHYDGKKYHDVYVDKNGNYMFYENVSMVPENDFETIKVVDRYQFCKFSEYVKKGDKE